MEEVASSGVSGAWWRRGWRSGPVAPSRTAPSGPSSAEADITGERSREAPRAPRGEGAAAAPADAGGGSLWGDEMDDIDDDGGGGGFFDGFDFDGE